MRQKNEAGKIAELDKQVQALLEEKQDLAEKAIQVKDNEIQRLLEQQKHLEKTIEELKVIIRDDKKEEKELQEEADKKQA